MDSFNEIWYFEYFSKNQSRKFEFLSNLTRTTDTLLEDVRTFRRAHWILLGMRSAGNTVLYKINTHILCSISFFNRVVYEIMWENTVETDRPQTTIWQIRIAYRIPKATNKNPQNMLILITFPLQQWVHEHASMLRCMYTAYFVRFL